MTLEEALAKIVELEAEAAGLKEEKVKILNKNEELIGKLKKFKKFEAHADVDIDELVEIKQKYESIDSEEKSRYKSLYETDKANLEKRLQAIEKERQAEKEQREVEQKQLAAEKLKANAILEFSKPEHNIFNPDQLFRLTSDRIRYAESGSIVAGDEYKELSLAEFVKELQADNTFANQFKSSGAIGSGSLPNVNSTAGIANPWKSESFNLTQQGRLLRENPKLAASLKAAAGVK